MTFLEVLEQVRGLLRSQGRISYRALKRQFELDDEYVADLKEALFFAHPQVTDEDGRGLGWIGGAAKEESENRRIGETGKGSSESKAVRSAESEVRSPQPPVAYTPKHLAERILAEQAAMEARGAPDGERK